MTERIDAHHHVWDLSVRAQPWMNADTMASIARSFTFDEFTGVAAANNVTSSVLVQTVASIDETEELLDLASTTPLVRGVVGYVNLEGDDVDDQLDRLCERRTGGALVGIRAPAEDEPDPAWLVRPAVIAGVRVVADRDLTCDVLVRWHQLKAAVAMVRSVPECRFVLDHLGKPPIAAQEWEPWASDISALAESPNVCAKFSGLVTEAEWSSWSTHTLEPYVDWALHLFGPERLMFGSDWPVCTLAASYTQVVETAETMLSKLSDSERDAVFSRTAKSAYTRLDRRVV